MEILDKDYKRAAELIKQGRIGIIPTDTIYGFSCLANSKELVERVYQIKQREFEKPFIFLIPSIDCLKDFGIDINDFVLSIVSKYWPGPISIIFKVESEELEFLHRGTNALAFRLPSKKDLLELLSITGPIVSTSANVSGEPSINSLEDAQVKFGNSVNFILWEGESHNPPSKIIKLEDNKEIVVRA